MKTSLFYKYSALILLIINIVIVTFLIGRPKPREHERPIHAAKNLQLTSEQESQFLSLAKNHQQSMRDIQDQQKHLFVSYFETLYTATIDKSEETVDAIVAFERQKIELTYHHFEDVKALLDKDQMLNYKAFILKTTQLIHGQKSDEHPPR
jgi:hypothetical protein